jgi:hypothetical protein
VFFYAILAVNVFAESCFGIDGGGLFWVIVVVFVTGAFMIIGVLGFICCL